MTGLAHPGYQPEPVCLADIDTALTAAGEDPDAAVAFNRWGELTVTVPSVGVFGLFAAALAARLVIASIDDNEDVDRPDVAAGRVRDLFAEVSTDWGSGDQPDLVVTFHALRVDTMPGAPAEKAPP